MTTNRFLAALLLLLGKPVARLTFPPGVTVMPGSILIEGVGLRLRGWHIKQTFTTDRDRQHQRVDGHDVTWRERQV